MKCGIFWNSWFSQFPKKWVPELKYTLHGKKFLSSSWISCFLMFLCFCTMRQENQNSPAYPLQHIHFLFLCLGLNSCKILQNICPGLAVQPLQLCTTDGGELAFFRIPLCNKQHILMCSILFCITAFSKQLENLAINCKIPCLPDRALKPSCFIARVLQVYFLWQILEMSLAQFKGQMPVGWIKTL